ncbi:MAG: anthranilate phosphoribosyltransferase [Syntrophomonadaceae bacterium]|nr:anthranilate phosphoribosyltransferase [Syntrophomonadaceae bacterium]
MKSVLQKITHQMELNQDDINTAIFGIKEGSFSSVQVAGFLMGLLMKGLTTSEIAGIARSMRQACVSLSTGEEDLIDTCGTGGGLTTFNVSTANALLSCAGGVKIAKHGSRSISASSGSADVLEALGIPVELEPHQAEQLIEEIGFSFLYAPLYHPVMMKVFGPESDLGIKTIFFTVIGPIINPANARRHVLGVYQPHLLEQVAEVVRELDLRHVMVVHGVDGLDEISLMGETRIAEVLNGQIKYYTIAPEDFGLKRCTLKDIQGGSPEYNARVIRNIFAGIDTGPKRDMVLLNAAATFIVAGKAASFAQGLAIGTELIDSGIALAKLDQIIARTREIRGRIN